MPKGKLKFAFFGPSLVSAYWNGAATYYRGLIRALHQRGHNITFYEPDVLDRQSHRDIPPPPYARSVIYSADTEGPVREALKDAESADIVIKCSGVGVFDELLDEAVLAQQDKGKLVAFWDVDAPDTLERITEDPGSHFRPLVPKYDLIFTYGGGAPVIEAYTKLGAHHCVPIYNAVDPATHHPVQANDKFECLLGLLANRFPDRETRVHEFFFKAAQELSKSTFVLGGSGWDNNLPSLPNVKYLGHVYTAEHNAFNSTPHAILNVSRESMARFGFSPPTRLFEAAGAAACIITDTWDGIDCFLEPGRECLVARNGEDVAQILQELSEERAREIGSRALRRVLAQHTYAHRAMQVENALRGLAVPAKG